MVMEYYDNHLEPFFDGVADEVLWVGPRSGQIIQGKDNIIKTWSSIEDVPRFSMGNIEAKSVSTGVNNLEVLLEYYVYTYFPDGSIDQHHQRLHYSWGMIKDDMGRKIPKAFMIHLSNMAQENNTEQKLKVYASSLSDSQKDALHIPGLSKISFRTIYGKGRNEIKYYFNMGTILWIESTDGGRHCIVHTLEGDFEAIENLRYFEEQAGEDLIRAHASYLVNPMYVRSLRRFTLTLSSGTELSIPEKKYTAFRKKLAAWNGNIRSD